MNKINIVKVVDSSEEDNSVYIASEEYISDYVEQAFDLKELLEILDANNIEYSVCFLEDYEEIEI